LLVRRLLPVARSLGARVSLHGEAVVAQHAGADGVHLPAGADAHKARARLGSHKLIGVSIHTVTDAEALDPDCVDYALAGPAFETLSKPGYGPEIGRSTRNCNHRKCRPQSWVRVVSWSQLTTNGNGQSSVVGMSLARVLARSVCWVGRAMNDKRAFRW
jgi:hypothetical protein